MKKILGPLITGAVVAAVVASALLCCCVGNIAQAHSLKTAAAPASCQGDRSSHQKDAMPCDCCSVKAVPAEVSQLSAVVAPSFSKVFYPHEAMLAFGQSVRIASSRTAYGGTPQGRLCSVPLYLQDRSLRL